MSDYPILPETVAETLPACWLGPGEAWMVPEGLQQVEAGLDLRFLSQHGLFRALYVEEDPVWLVGLHRLWPGVGVIWQRVLAPDLVHAHSLALVRLVYREWAHWRQREPWRWIESQILAEDRVSGRFLSWLGFTVWTSKPGYGPSGETIHLYVWRGEP